VKRSRSRLRALATFLFLGLAACGDDTTPAVGRGAGEAGADGSRGGDASPDAGVDGADAAPGYPAFPVDAPQIQKNHGTILTAPVIVTVTWPSDASASTWEAFDDGIGASSYWAATTAEYGVGKATSGATDHVRMNQPLPASLSYTDLQNLVAAALQRAVEADGGAPEGGASDGGPQDPVWPAPTLDAQGNPQTFYSLFIPPSTAVTDPGSGMPFCNGAGTGYHASVPAGALTVAYSVTLECPSTGADAIEETAAHESVETATDPFNGTSTDGYHGFDADHLAWDLYDGFADELADACQFWQSAYVQEMGAFPYWVQRSWSNQAAQAGHDPCVPAAGPYHGVTLFPAEEAQVSVNLAVIGAGTVKSRGFDVKIGQPLTFHVGFFSDAPTGPWKIGYDFPSTLQTFDMNFVPLGNGSGTVALSQTTGSNGDRATVTVTPTAKGEGGFQVMAITWDPPTKSGFAPRALPVLLVDH